MKLPPCLPDETLYSRECRGLITNSYSKSQYLNIICGSSRGSLHPFLASDIDRLAKVVGEPPNDLLYGQSLNPLFARFLPKSADVLFSFQSSANEITRSTQVSAFREKEKLDLKYCPLCAVEDIKEFGVSYWHRSHQIPGVESCFKHQHWLSHQGLVGRSHLTHGYLPKPTIGWSSPSYSEAFSFAIFTRRFLDKLTQKGLMRSVDYMSLLKNKGLASDSGRIRRNVLVKELYLLSQKLIPFKSPLYPRSEEDFSYWQSLFYNTSQQHPFKHMLLLYYLASCNNRRKLELRDIEAEKMEIEKKCLDGLKRQLSLAEVGRRIGKSRSYVKAIALKNGYLNRLKCLTHKSCNFERIIFLAYKGFHRREIAKRVGVSVGTVEYSIALESGLAEHRRKCKKDSKRRRYKYQITHFLQSNKCANRVDVKRECNAAFYWLYKHEPGWLAAVLPSPLQPNPPGKVSKDMI